ncbi:MAG: hypothetical protein ACE5GO_10745 [Anaerolineales bacterium]
MKTSIKIINLLIVVSILFSTAFITRSKGTPNEGETLTFGEGVSQVLARQMPLKRVASVTVRVVYDDLGTSKK